VVRWDVFPHGAGTVSEAGHRSKGPWAVTTSRTIPEPPALLFAKHFEATQQSMPTLPHLNYRSDAWIKILYFVLFALDLAKKCALCLLGWIKGNLSGTEVLSKKIKKNTKWSFLQKISPSVYRLKIISFWPLFLPAILKSWTQSLSLLRRSLLVLSLVARPSLPAPCQRSQNHSITKVGKDLQDHQVQLSPQPHRACWTVSLSATSTRFLNPSRDGDSTTSLGSLVQCLTALAVKTFFLNI